MHNDLLISLINSGVLQLGTEVTVLRAGRDMAGSQTVYSRHQMEVSNIEVIDTKALLIVRSTLDGKPFNVRAQHILQIDGMEPERLATAFKTDGKKRGRKPNPK